MTTTNIEKLDRLPDAALSQLSQNIETSESSVNSESSGIGLVAENEVLQGGKHADLTGVPGLGDANTVPASDKPATPPVITQATGTKQPVAIGTLFNGKAGIELVDMLFPALIILVADNVLGYAIDKKDLQLTASEKNTIAPFMQSYLDSVNVHMSPLGALIAVMSGVYAAKFMEAFPNIKKKSKAQTKQPPARLPDVVNMTPESSKEIMQRIAKTKDLDERRKAYCEFVAPMAYETAVAHIKTTRRISAADAKKWYTKFVLPIKQKR